MIRWTKDGKMYREDWPHFDPPFPQADKIITELADAFDVAVAALRWYADPVAYSMPVQNMEHHVFPDRGKTASDALRHIGADHAD